MSPFTVRPEVSKRLVEREPEPHESHILMALREMYSCRHTPTTFDIYATGAVFHGPIGIANGVDSIRNQFVALSRLFPRADIPSMRVLTIPGTVPPNPMLIDQDVRYLRDAKSPSPTKEINSLLRLNLQEGTNNLKVTSHYEECDHSKSNTSDDGVFGWMNEMRKRATAAIQRWRGRQIDPAIGGVMTVVDVVERGKSND
ncbi:hypothetical protein FA13DRAFT_1724781 [Coprinellus micaceus]|uniref:Uncharacterized protein n=1 Tax=Coprinellus micaceus TaxID=71717 RepID=A0A4Y7TZ13_COPMI|nr:hypothetical protein FA13DRAFT_1724781 [Coprinellus micaceus]